MWLYYYIFEIIIDNVNFRSMWLKKIHFAKIYESVYHPIILFFQPFSKVKENIFIIQARFLCESKHS